MDKVKKKVAVIIYTRGLNYDDRIPKEITALTSSDNLIEVKIFAVVHENKEDWEIHFMEFLIIHLI